MTEPTSWAQTSGIGNLTSASGGDGTDYEYTITPPLPAGLTFNDNRRFISGNPTAASPLNTYTYMAKDEAGNPVSTQFTIVGTQTTLPPIRNQIMAPDEAIATLQLPDATGGTSPYTYTLEGDLPDGLTYNTVARSIMGTPPRFSGALAFTYKATDANGIDGSRTFKIRTFAPRRPPGLAPVAVSVMNSPSSLSRASGQLDRRPLRSGSKAPPSPK